jgi:hypothetical protein
MENNVEREYKIRPLKRKDRKTVSAMIAKMADKLGNTGILNLISSATTTTKSADGEKKQNDNSISIGIEIIKLLITTLEDDVTAWFADLIGVSIADFDELPIDIEIQIIEQLRKAPEVGVFFSGASRQFKEIPKFAALSKNVNLQ